MTSKIKVLLAEDDLDDRTIFVSFLKDRCDISILPCAENGLEVLKILNAITDSGDLPDMILLDHNMPLVSGEETIELLKSNPKYTHIPIFIYSTYADKSLLAKCITSGADMVYEKPVTKDGYDRMIDAFLKRMHHYI